MITKGAEGRVRDLGSWAFRAGEDLSEIKREIGELRTAVDHTRQGIDLLLGHYGIERPLSNHGENEISPLRVPSA